VTLPFYFICLLHLANEKGLRLESTSLEDFMIMVDNGAAPSFGVLPNQSATGESTTSIVEQRERRAKEMTAYQDMESDEDSDSE
jgi:condensin complex subunit 2